jgi:hypothetical protein
MGKRKTDDTGESQVPPQKKQRQKTDSDDVSTSSSEASTLGHAISAKLVVLPEGIPTRRHDRLLNDPVWKLVYEAVKELKKVKLSWIPSADSSGKSIYVVLYI